MSLIIRPYRQQPDIPRNLLVGVLSVPTGTVYYWPNPVQFTTKQVELPQNLLPILISSLFPVGRLLDWFNPQLPKQLQLQPYQNLVVIITPPVIIYPIIYLTSAAQSKISAIGSVQTTITTTNTTNRTIGLTGDAGSNS